MSRVYEIRGEDLVWLIGAVVCLCAAPRVQLFVSAGNGKPRDRHGIIGSCQDCKALLVMSLTDISSAIASTRPLPLSFTAEDLKASPYYSAAVTHVTRRALHYFGSGG